MSKKMYSLDDNCEVFVDHYFEDNKGKQLAFCYLSNRDNPFDCRIRNVERLVELDVEELEITNESLEWNDVD